MDYNEKFEILAEEFNKEFGFYPIGKDVRYSRPISDEKCMELWSAFLGRKMAEETIEKLVKETKDN